MKALTVKEPYASLIVNGIKEYEFRSWKTSYRGELYIHDYPKSLFYEGIGLTNLTIDPHFDINDKEWVNENKKFS